MKRKFLFVGLACLMAFGAAGCGKSKDDANTLEIAVNIGGYGSEGIRAIAKKFEKENPGVEVKVNDVYLRLDQLEANLKNPKSTTVDLYVTGNGSLLKGYVAKGDSFTDRFDGVILEELSDVYEGTIPGESQTVEKKMYSEFSEFYKWDLDEDGKDERYIMPWHSNVMSFIYNTDVVGKALNGKPLPRTTDEFEALCKVIQKDGVYPFVLTLDPAAQYWQGPVETWWAQYSTVAEYDNFFRGIRDNRYNKDIYTDKGRLVALKEMERFIHRKNGFTHPDSPSFEFSPAQNTVFSGTSAFMANGDWFENEMKDSDSKSQNIAMMKVPVTSSLCEKLSFYKDGDTAYFDLPNEKKNGYDTLLSKIVAYVDGDLAREKLETEVKDSDIEMVKNARCIVKTNASTASMFVPAFATAKEKAKDFLRFMAKDECLTAFMENSSGSHLVYDFDFDKDEESKNIYDGLSLFRKSVYDIENDCQFIRFINEPIEYKGGLMPYTDLSTQIEKYMISSNPNDNMTGQEIYDYCINYMDDNRWENILRTAGIKQ